MKKKIFGILFVLVLVLGFSLVPAMPALAGGASTTYYVATTGDDTCGDGSETWVDTDNSTDWSVGDTGPWLTIQRAIDQCTGGETIEVAAGTYPEALNLGDRSLTIDGAGVDATIVDASTFNVYAIQEFGDSSTVRDLTLIGSTKYGFKVSHVSDFNLDNVKVENSYKTAFDLNTVTSANLNNVEAINTAAGFGLMILDSTGVNVNNIATSGNAWGGVSVQTKGGPTNSVTFSGDFDVEEEIPLLLEKDPPTYYPITNVTIPSKFQYVVHAFREGDDYKQTFFQETLDDAKGFAQSLVGSQTFTYSHILICDVAKENYYVIEGMKVQDAVDAATDNDTVNVAAGEYDEQVVTDKNLTLEGAGDTTIVKPSSADVLTQHFTIPWAGGTKEVAGIIVADGTANVTVKNLKVVGDDVTAWPAGAQWVAGILYRESGGVIDNATVTNLEVVPLDWGRGQAILLSAVDAEVTVEVMNSRISNYDKNGITALGATLTANIHDNEVVGRGPLPGEDEVQNGIMIIQDAAGTVNDNAVSNHAYITGEWGATGILFCNASGSAKGNTSVDNQMGVVAQILTHDWGDFGGYTQEVSFEGNRVDASGLDVPVISGINAATYADGASLTVTIVSNDLTGGAGNGISIGDTEDLGAAGNVMAAITLNSIYEWDTAINNLTGNPLDATNNWWGSNQEPGVVSGNVSCDPWLVIGISADPTGIEANGTSTSTITADMTRNSDGEDTSGDGHIPDGTDITFSTSKGSITGTKTADGMATATLTSSTTVETASVKVSAPPHTPAATATTAVFFTKSGVGVEGSRTEETTSGNVTIDAKDEADTEVEKKGDGTPTITVAKYDSNPGSGFSGDTGTYIDVHADNVTGVDEIVIKLYYTNDDIRGKVESSLKLRWWNGTDWKDCSDSGVDPTDITGPPAYSGYMWAKIRDDTTPSLSDLSGTVFGGKGKATPSEGGGGGGGTPPLDTNLFGKTGSFSINYLGIVQKEIKATSADGFLTIDIPKGTKALNKNGNPLSSLTAKSNDSPPDPPEGSNIIGLAYDFGPDGATFQPGITLIWSYDPDTLPEGVEAKNLVIAYYDAAAKKWVEVAGEVDTANNKVTANVTHFTTYAMLGAVTPPATTPPVTPPATTPPATTPPATTPPATTPPVTPPATTPPATTPPATTPPATTPPATTPPPPAPMATYWWYIIGIVGVIVIVGVIGLVVWRRRR